MSSSRPRVLLADDYPDIVKAVSRLLAQDCEIVGSVADGSACWRRHNDSSLTSSCSM